MYGAIVGDIIGSVYERENTSKYDFPFFSFKAPLRSGNSRFTDDTVLTVATASALLKLSEFADMTKDFDSFTTEWFAAEYRDFFRRFPDRGYGRGFSAWTKQKINTIGDSFGNGSAMRVSPVAWVYDNLDDVLRMAELTASCSHSHEEGIKGAKAIAMCIFLARQGESKAGIEKAVVDAFEYDLYADMNELMKGSSFAACQATVPPAIRAFLESENYEDAVRRAIIVGGDSDTIAAMSGSIAEAYYRGVPTRLRSVAYILLPVSMRKIVTQFRRTYKLP